MVDKEKVGKIIALQRKSCELTQKELADLLHVSYQAVSKWELGQSLPTVELISEIAKILNVTVDYLLNADEIENRDICYKDIGLDTVRLYDVKGQIDHMVTKDPDLLYSHYTMPVVIQNHMEQYKEPVYAMITNVPGSKLKYAKERGYDCEICSDLVARSVNYILSMGLRPKVLQAHLVCGNNEAGQLLNMGKAFKKACEENNTIFAGMEISSQPINYLSSDYELSVALVGEGDRSDLITGKNAQEGDVLIALKTEGIDSTSFPFIRVMLDREPKLAYAMINKQKFFMEEILKPNFAYTDTVNALTEKKLAKYMIRVGNSFLCTGAFYGLPEQLCAVINLSSIRVDEISRFMVNLNLLGKNFFPYRFSFGVGMIIAVPKNRVQEALEIINQKNECYIIGHIEKRSEKTPKNGIQTEGKIRW